MGHTGTETIKNGFSVGFTTDFVNSLRLPIIYERPEVDCTRPLDDDCCISQIIPFLESIRMNTATIKQCYSKDPLYWRRVITWLYSMTNHFTELSIAKSEDKPDVVDWVNTQMEANLTAVPGERQNQVIECFHRACDVLSLSYASVTESNPDTP
jgi:hypothetical protein